MLALFAERGGDPDAAGQEAPAGLPALAGRPAGGAVLGARRLRAARRPAGLARRVRGDRAEAPRRRLRRAGRRQRPGVPAPRDERLGGRRSSPARGRSPGTTCTPGWSGSTARRCRSRAATWSSSRHCAATDATRWRSASPCSPTTTAATGTWTEADLTAGEARLARWRAAVAQPAGPPADARPGRRPPAPRRRPGRPRRPGRRRPLGAGGPHPRRFRHLGAAAGRPHRRRPPRRPPVNKIVRDAMACDTPPGRRVTRRERRKRSCSDGGQRPRRWYVDSVRSLAARHQSSWVRYQSTVCARPARMSWYAGAHPVSARSLPASIA